MNAVSHLSADQLACGVITHSSGNHAQALALAARMNDALATVVMPSTASAVKRAAVMGYGATVIDCQPTLESREQTTEKIQKSSGAIFIHPFDDPRIIAGQGTAAMELLEDEPDLDIILTPVGGGGLLSGTAIAANAINPEIKVIAAEPSGADDAFRSKAANELIMQTSPDTIADGLLTSLGNLTWPIVRDQVDAIVTVTDDEIVAAMRMLWQRAKLLVEPSSATVLAAVLSEQFPDAKPNQKIGLILSGGNVDLDNLPWMNKM